MRSAAPQHASHLLEPRYPWICFTIFAALLITPLSAEDRATPRLESAARALSAGDLNRAEGELQTVLRSSPSEHRALDLLGVVRVLQHRPGDAEILFKRSIQGKPTFPSAHAHLGLLYIETGRANDAIPELQDAIHLDPSRTDAADALVHIFREKAQRATSAGDVKRALGLLIEARKLSPKNADVQFEFATAALETSFFEDAVDGFLETLSERQDDAPAIYGLGRAYGGLGRLDDARRQFARYIELHPDDPSGYCSLGMTLAALDRYDEARTPLERSIALAPEQTEAYFQLGILELHANNWDRASSNLGRVLDRNPRHAGALAALGRIAFEQKHYPEAIERLRQAIVIDDTLREAHYDLALTYARTGRKSEAQEEFQRATQLDREDTEKRRRVLNRLDLMPAIPMSQ